MLEVASQLFDHNVAVMSLFASHILAILAAHPTTDLEQAIQCMVLITAGNLPLARSVCDVCLARAQEAIAKKDSVCFTQITSVLLAIFAAWREDCFVADLAAVFLAAFAKEAADGVPLLAAALKKYAETLELLPSSLGVAFVGATGLNAVLALGRGLPALSSEDLVVVMRVMAGVYRHAVKKEGMVEVMVRVCAAVSQRPDGGEAMAMVKGMVLELATAHGKEMKVVLQDLPRNEVRVVQNVLRKAIEEKGEGKKKKRASHTPILLDENKFM